MIHHTLIRLVCPLLLLITTTISFASPNSNFHSFVQDIKKEAKLGGISDRTLKKYFAEIKAPKPKLIKKVKHMHETLVPFDIYLAHFIKAKSVNHGLKQFQKHHHLLKKIAKQFQVPGEILVALWGIESNYGRFTGHASLIQALTTLSYQNIRSQFYRTQLLYALKMLDKSKVLPAQLKSSWDGGMGQAQFTPEAYFEFAVDYDHDGIADLWNSTPDALASIANYLHHHKWKKNGACFIKVTLPKNFPLELANKNIRRPLSSWLALGVKLPKHTKLQQSPFEQTAVIAPNGNKGPAFIGLHNFFTLLEWNNSANEALSTCHLASYFKANSHAHHFAPNIKLQTRRKVKAVRLTQLN